jgi:hypothetical protein
MLKAGEAKYLPASDNSDPKRRLMQTRAKIAVLSHG